MLHYIIQYELQCITFRARAQRMSCDFATNRSGEDIYIYIYI